MGRNYIYCFFLTPKRNRKRKTKKSFVKIVVSLNLSGSSVVNGCESNKKSRANERDNDEKGILPIAGRYVAGSPSVN